MILRLSLWLRVVRHGSQSIKLHNFSINSTSWTNSWIFFYFLHTDKHQKGEETRTTFRDCSCDSWPSVNQFPGLTDRQYLPDSVFEEVQIIYTYDYTKKRTRSFLLLYYCRFFARNKIRLFFIDITSELFFASYHQMSWIKNLVSKSLNFNGNLWN